MWILQTKSPSFVHVPHKELLLSPPLRVRNVPTGSMVLEVGLGHWGRELWLLRMLSRSGEGEEALSRHLTLALHTPCLSGKG